MRRYVKEVLMYSKITKQGRVCSEATRVHVSFSHTTPSMLIFRMQFALLRDFSSLKKYAVFCSPSSNHCFLDLTYAPSALTLYISSSLSCCSINSCLSSSVRSSGIHWVRVAILAITFVSSSFLNFAREDPYSLRYFATSNFNNSQLLRKHFSVKALCQ